MVRNYTSVVVLMLDLVSDKSGKKKSINEAIPSNAIPIKNHMMGLRPIRLAKNAVTNGILNKTIIPKEMKSAAPIVKLIYHKINNLTIILQYYIL